MFAEVFANNGKYHLQYDVIRECLMVALTLLLGDLCGKELHKQKGISVLYENLIRITSDNLTGEVDGDGNENEAIKYQDTVTYQDVQL